MHLPKAVIFDMDGLMLDTEKIYQKAWKAAAGSLGLDLSDETCSSLIGRGNDEIGLIFAEAFGPQCPVTSLYKRQQDYWYEIASFEGIALKRGLEALLDWLEAENIPKAVGTSSPSKDAEFCLSATGIHQRFAAVVTADMVAASKPAPDLFLEAARQLKQTPANCLVLEDSNAGVRAASAAGIPVVMVPDLQAPDDRSRAIACEIFTSLREVKAWLEQLHTEQDLRKISTFSGL